jgi:hypothetical protein
VKLKTLSKALIAAVAIAAAGMIWERTALDVFSKEAGGVRGMIGGPRSPDDGHFDYTLNGRHYELWALKVPMCSTGALLFLVGVTATAILVLEKNARDAFLLWVGIVIGYGGLLVFTFAVCWEAYDVFF